MDTRNVNDVKKSANEVAWHTRQAAIILQHALGPWGNLTIAHGTTPEDVRTEQVKSQNLIGKLCDQMARFLQVANGREEIDPNALVEKLIEMCDLVGEDKRVGLREILEDHGREDSQGEKPPADS